jgi:hypothetical protein
MTTDSPTLPNPSIPGGSNSRQLATRCAIAFGLGLLIVGIVLSFFSPRLMVWDAWWQVQEYFYGPELGRARTALWQADHLGAPITDPIHGLIRWRLLFPGLAHFLHLPPWLHLALYPLGTLASAIAMVWFWAKSGATWFNSFIVSLAITANAWFFTGTCWLAYGDAWVVFGLIVVTLSRKLWPAIVVGFIFPWCDDRFVMAMPLAIVCRLFYFQGFSLPDWRTHLKSLALICSGPIVFVIARIILEISTEGQSMAKYFAPTLKGNEWIFVWGAWEAWRAAWILPVVALLWALRSHKVYGGIILIGALLTFSVAFFTVFDLSRAGAVLLPLVLAGAAQVMKKAQCIVWIGSIAALNLALPATHIIANIQTPIWPLRYELHLLRNPTPPYEPVGYAMEALKQFRAGQAENGAQLLTIAKRLDSKNFEVVRVEAIVNFEAGHRQGAVELLQAHLRTAPQDRDSRAILAEMLAALGERSQAQEAASSAVEGLPADHPLQTRLRPILGPTP